MSVLFISAPLSSAASLPERGESMSELEDGSELELGVELLGSSGEVVVDGDVVVDRDELSCVELELGAVPLLDDDGVDGRSAVRHSLLRRVSVVVFELDGVELSSCAAAVSVELECVVVVECDELDVSDGMSAALLGVLLGVLAALGVFVVDDDSGIVCVVVDSATRVCSCTVRCC